MCVCVCVYILPLYQPPPPVLDETDIFKNRHPEDLEGAGRSGGLVSLCNLLVCQCVFTSSPVIFQCPLASRGYRCSKEL